MATFPPAWTALTSALRRRRDVAPQSVLQLYALALMASADAAAWTHGAQVLRGDVGLTRAEPV